jgi:Fic family protein
MAKVVRKRWASEIAEGLSRRDRRSCEYEAYVPDRLEGRRFQLNGDVAADVTDAERAVERLHAQSAALVDTEALARLLLRAESVASSRIEGLEVGSRRLLRAELERDLGEGVRDVTAHEVLGNIEAMRWSVAQISAGVPIRAEHLLECHRRLLSGTRMEDYAGTIRARQNWIGGSSYNPCSAVFGPPPPEFVASLVNDLVAFCNRDDLPAVAQAAIAHAQFETIHPFADGNGRTGRALIHLVLRRRAAATTALVPVSLVLATWSRDYVESLTRFRYRGSANTSAAHEGINQWVAFFARAVQRAAEDAIAFEGRIRELRDAWREQLGSPRANSAVSLLLDVLPGALLVTVNGAAALIGRSFQSTNEGIRRLLKAGILVQINIGRRNRAFEAPGVVDAFTALERQLASPEGDTRTSPPTRRVPMR